MISDDILRARLASGIAEMAIEAGPEALEQLLRYLKLLAKWNHAYNLTAVRDIQDMIPRHLLDSLSVAPFLRGETFVDVGTGPGLPGIPLAILFPNRRFLLVDSNGKKTRFLTQCKLELGLPNIEIRQARIEQVQLPDRPDGILSRAFASVADFVQWTEHLVGPGTRLYAMKGLYPEEELAALPASFVVLERHRLLVPGCDAQRHLLIMARAQEAAVGRNDQVD